MNAIRTTFWLVALNAAVALSTQDQAVAGVTLQSGTTIEFATVEQGREVLANRDEFIEMMSPLDWRLRMKTTATVTETQFLRFIQNQVQTWSAAEQTRFSNIVAAIQAPIANLNLSLPATILLIKTTGNEEGNSSYVRGSSIILPQSVVSASSNSAAQLLTHELFHVYTWHNAQLREALYGVLGVRLCNEIPFPPWLQARRIATPNPVPWDFVIRVKVSGVPTPVMPIYYYNSTNYLGGSFPNYISSKLLVLEETMEGFRASCGTNGVPRFVDSEYNENLSDYYQQIGENTSYNIHPEETLADNFMQIVLGTKDVKSPRIHHLLRRVLLSDTAPAFPAGRFTADLNLPDGQPRVLESSTDLLNWQTWDVYTNTIGSVEVRDTTAWLGGNRFFRARTGGVEAIEPGDTNNLVWIPPGTFLMGSPANEAGRPDNSESPQRTVTLTHGFWMGKCEVTQAEYQQVMGANPSWFAGISNQPVESVSWNDASNFCSRLTQQEQTAGRLPQGYAYRLPTEAEWEYAAGAGTTNRFSFGDDPDYLDCYRQMWFCDDSIARPHLVATTSANPWGLHDMHGNVLEWCQDWYGAYSGGSVTDPKGPLSGPGRVIRGGAWGVAATDCRSASRAYASPGWRYYWIGFRVVLAPTTP